MVMTKHQYSLVVSMKSFPLESHACEGGTSTRVRPRRSHSSGAWYQSKLGLQYHRKMGTVEYPFLILDILLGLFIGHTRTCFRFVYVDTTESFFYSDDNASNPLVVPIELQPLEVRGPGGGADDALDGVETSSLLWRWPAQLILL